MVISLKTPRAFDRVGHSFLRGTLSPRDFLASGFCSAPCLRGRPFFVSFRLLSLSLTLPGWDAICSLPGVALLVVSSASGLLVTAARSSLPPGHLQRTSAPPPGADPDGTPLPLPSLSLGSPGSAFPPCLPSRLLPPPKAARPRPSSARRGPFVPVPTPAPFSHRGSVLIPPPAPRSPGSGHTTLPLTAAPSAPGATPGVCSLLASCSFVLA